MPCNTMTKVKLELKNANTDLLKKAVEAMGYRNVYHNGDILSWATGSYDKATGMLTLDRGIDGNAIRRAYTGEVVKKQASRFGWQVKQVANNKYEIIKR